MEKTIAWKNLDLNKDFPEDGERLAGTSWEWHLFDSSPFGGFSSEPVDWSSPDARSPRLRYAPWLKGRGHPGIYLWLLPRPGTRVGDGRFRFVHVGMSTTDVHERIREHCRNQFRRGDGRTLLCTYDRIHPLPTSGGGHEFGILGKALWNGARDRPGRDEWKHAEESTFERYRVARAFLESARLVLMRPGTNNGALTERIRMIKTLERVVGRAASALLQVSGENEQTTNSGMNSPCGPLGSEDIVARDLNRMTQMLPVLHREA